MKKVILLALAAGIMTQSICCAEEIKISKTGGSVVVEGSLDLGEQAYAADMTVTAYDSDNNINYIDIIPLSKDGKAAFKYYNLGNSGNYTYTFSVPSLNISRTATLEGFIGNDYWEAFVAKINGYVKAGELDKLKADIEAEKDNLALDMTDYDLLADKDKVFEVMKNDFESDYKNAEEVVTDFYRAVALCKFKEGGTFDDYYKNEYVGLKDCLPSSESEDGISVLDDLSAEAKSAVIKAVSSVKSDFDRTADAKEGILSNILYRGIANAESYMDVKKLLNAYAEAGLLSVDKDMSEKVYKALIGNSYSSYSAIESAVKSAKSSGGTSNGSSSGGSSGGSSSGGTSSSSTSGVVVSPSANTKPVETIDGSQSGKMTFSDMEDAKWALKAVENLYAKGIVSGNGDGKFNPHNSVKREEMAKMLVDLAGYAKESSYIPFYDVNADSWSYNYICAAYANGLISGLTEYEFGTGAEITREQAVTLLYRALKNKGVEMPGTEFRFDDDYLISDWAKEGIYGLYSIGVIGGKTKTTFVPKENMTRVEVAVMLNGAVKYFDGGDA